LLKKDTKLHIASGWLIKNAKKVKKKMILSIILFTQYYIV